MVGTAACRAVCRGNQIMADNRNASNCCFGRNKLPYGLYQTPITLSYENVILIYTFHLETEPKVCQNRENNMDFNLQF